MIIGVTGGIGCGKTFVCNLFAEKGIPVYISDIEAKKLMNSNVNVKKGIIELFGDEAYNIEGLNRKYISRKVFSNKSLLEKLNKIVHPAVANHFESWCKKERAGFVIKESAILFETGGDKKCDITILVTAPLDVRIKRVIERDGITEDQVLQRIKNQWTDQKKTALASYVITNIEKKQTMEQVNLLYSRFIQMF